MGSNPGMIPTQHTSRFELYKRTIRSSKPETTIYSIHGSRFEGQQDTNKDPNPGTVVIQDARGFEVTNGTKRSSSPGMIVM